MVYLIKMGMGNVLILGQVTAYLLILIIAFFIIVPLSLNKAQFGGHCLLYADARWVMPSNASEYVLSDVKWGPSGSCNFAIFAGVIEIPLSMFFILWMSVYLYKNTDPSWLTAFLSFLCNLVVMVMMFAVSLVLTVGFSQWCDLLAGGRGQLSSCENAQYTLQFKERDVYAGYFHLEFSMAMFGAWTSWISWFILTVMAASKLYIYHSDEDFFTSMSRERQRLIQRVQQRPDVLA